MLIIIIINILFENINIDINIVYDFFIFLLLPSCFSILTVKLAISYHIMEFYIMAIAVSLICIS